MTDSATEAEQERPPVETKTEEQDLLSLLQRERADFLNYRRRASQERAEERVRGRVVLLTELLPLLDDLDRAMTQVPEELTDHPWTRGIALSRRRLLDFLAKQGVEPVGAEGEPFDPVRHEAIFFEERPGISEPRVTTVIRQGYRMGERVLRPAQVGVVGPAAELSGEDHVVEEGTGGK
jgi:molecular chaperone GrpE